MTQNKVLLSAFSALFMIGCLSSAHAMKIPKTETAFKKCMKNTAALKTCKKDRRAAKKANAAYQLRACSTQRKAAEQACLAQAINKAEVQKIIKFRACMDTKLSSYTSISIKAANAGKKKKDRVQRVARSACKATL